MCNVYFIMIFQAGPLLLHSGCLQLYSLQTGLQYMQALLYIMIILPNPEAFVKFGSSRQNKSAVFGRLKRNLQLLLCRRFIRFGESGLSDILLGYFAVD